MENVPSQTQLLAWNISERDYSREVLDSAFPGHVPDECRYVIVLTAALDDSGTHSDSEVVTIGGYLSHMTTWRDSFCPQWQSALDDCGDGWSLEEKQQRFERLARIIEGHAMTAIAVSVPRALYDATATPIAHKFVGGPYGLAVLECVLQMAGTFTDFAKLLPTPVTNIWVRYVIEAGTKGRHEIDHVLKEIQSSFISRAGFRVAGVAFESKTDFLPLQAADVMAYEAYRQMLKDIGSDPKPMRREYRRLLAKTYPWPARLVYFDKTQLEDRIEALESDAAAELRRYGGL